MIPFNYWQVALIVALFALAFAVPLLILAELT